MSTALSCAAYRTELRHLRVARFLEFWRTPTFGVRWHGFRCEPRASAGYLAEFEDRWGITLPEEYRALLMGVGNGCAGPYYGFSPLEEWCAPGLQEEVPPDTLSSPFTAAGGRSAGLAPGALRVCNAGCEHYYLLVVSGPHRGEIWRDSSVDGLGLVPIRTSADTEGGSLVSWLDEWLAAVRASSADNASITDPFWSDTLFPGHAVHRVLADVGVGEGRTVAVDQLPCPVCIRALYAHDARRAIVPAERGRERRNPKMAAIAAAKGRARVTPRLVFP
jgi:hypothetical protein